jgi:hypothetical protein
MIGGVALRVSSPVLVGRAAEAAQLWAAFERARADSPAVVVVAGEAGVGKTRLVTELLGRVRAQGALALTGGCLDVGEGVVAYAPLVEALRSLSGAVDPAELERVLGGARAELARLVPELGAPGEVYAAPGAGALMPGRLFELLPSPAGGWTTTCSPRSRRSRPSTWLSCCARRSRTTSW